MPRIQITARGIKVKENLKEYISKKISKLNRLVNTTVTVKCEVIKHHKSIGLGGSFEFEVYIHLPKADIKVERKGDNIFELVDQVDSILLRSVKRYKDKLQRKKKKMKWSEYEFALLN